MSPSYNPPSPRMLRNITWNSEKPKEVRRLGIDAQEILRIMDDAYLPQPSTTDRALQESRAAYVDEAGHLHDAGNRPFPPIHKPSPPYNTLRHPGHRSTAAYWETFEANRPYQMDAFDSEDGQFPYRSSSVGPNASADSPLIQYEHSSFSGQKSRPRILATSGIQDKSVVEARTRIGRRLEEKEVGIEHEGGPSERQRNLKPFLTPKEKVRRTWIVTMFCVRLRVIRTQRWLKERVQSRDSDRVPEAQ